MRKFLLPVAGYSVRLGWQDAARVRVRMPPSDRRFRKMPLQKRRQNPL